jgi:hypothetical protein
MDPMNVWMWVMENLNSIFYYVEHAPMDQAKIIPHSHLASKLLNKQKWWPSLDTTI